jgi:HEAT repeat protein
MRWFILFAVVLALLLVLGFSLESWWGRNPHREGADLSHFHATAVPGHIEALKSEDAAARRKAATALWQIGATAGEATPALLETARDADPQVRAAAVQALGRTSQESQDAVPALIKALEDDLAEVRAAAATSLAETWRTAGKGRSGAGRPPAGRGNPGDPRRVVPLIPSYEALARKAVPLLTAALRDTDARVRACAAEALAETGPLAEPAVPGLVQLLQKDPDGAARLQATLALANVGPGARAAAPALVEKLQGEKADGVRVNTAVALGMIRSSPETVVPALVKTFLTDEHPDARMAAMVSIGQFGPEATIAIPLLREAARDPRNQRSEGATKNIDRLLTFIGKKAQEPQKERPGPPPQ